MCSVAELGAFGASSLTEFTLKLHPVPASVSSLELFNKGYYLQLIISLY